MPPVSKVIALPTTSNVEERGGGVEERGDLAFAALPPPPPPPLLYPPFPPPPPPFQHNHPRRRRVAPRADGKDAAHAQPAHLLFVQDAHPQPHLPRQVLRHLRQARRVDVVSRPGGDRAGEVLRLGDGAAPL